MRRLTQDDKLVEAIKTDWHQAALDPRTRALLAFSEKLTRTPWEMKEVDVHELRQHGLTDEQILAVVLLAGFFNLATRIADALGIPLDPQLTRGTPEYDAFLRGS
ncbi:MAG: hypothetical protein HYY26_00010 [Acidobacteria bacterium]|nr:hypothetical protein [Acidobacteriota bacterium]